MLGAAGADAAPAMWRVRDADSVIYLFGTLHALSPRADWRTRAYDAAYQSAQTVWFEADLDAADPSTVGALLARYGVDPLRRLSEKLAPADLASLQQQADIARIDHLRPWAAALMLSMQPALSRGARVASGADMTMTRTARAGAKQIRVFETLEDQARLFADLPEPAEIKYLTGVIRERARPPVRFSLPPTPASLEQAWLAGDLARVGPRLVGEMRTENPSLYEALLKRRNLAWAETLEKEMAGSGVELVNVGALHMVGDDGLPALMAARGFTVTRIQ
jgi:uncharacterized protein YbaP (TraB family)